VSASDSERDPRAKEVSRRRFLRNAGVVGLGVPALSMVLEACGSAKGGTAAASTKSFGVQGKDPFASHPTYKFTLVNHVTTNPFFVATRYGAQDACNLLNCTYDWVGSATSDVSQMQCDSTRKLTVIERTPVNRLPAGLLDAAQRNDPRMARHLARDLTLLQRNGAKVAEGDEWECSAPTRPVWGRDGDLEMIIEFPVPLLVRLDSLLVVALGVSRTQLRKLGDSGIVAVQGPGKTGTLRIWSRVTVIVSAHRCLSS
jgi:hypothetical protein